jgi:hypothetical protein
MNVNMNSIHELKVFKRERKSRLEVQDPDGEEAQETKSGKVQ